MVARPQAIFKQVILLLILISGSTLLTWLFSIRLLNQRESIPADVSFDENRAYNDVLFQTNLGPRVPGSTAHQEIVDWIKDELNINGWNVEIQEGYVGEFQIKNIIGKKGNGSPWILIGAHFDTRIYADKDPILEKRKEPVPGANDGASGVAVLMELGRILADPVESGTIWLVFFDAEDNGNINNRSWVMGSRYFVDQLSEYPDKVVILDMIGDKELGVFQEKNSDVQLTQELWDAANHLGYDNYFKSELKYRIIDDHLPFIEKGIAAVDIIDFDYPYWHTTKDTPDKISATSLKVVGNTILFWLRTIQEEQK